MRLLEWLAKIFGPRDNGEIASRKGQVDVKLFVAGKRVRLMLGAPTAAIAIDLDPATARELAFGLWDCAKIAQRGDVPEPAASD